MKSTQVYLIFLHVCGNLQKENENPKKPLGPLGPFYTKKDKLRMGPDKGTWAEEVNCGTVLGKDTGETNGRSGLFQSVSLYRSIPGSTPSLQG